MKEILRETNTEKETEPEYESKKPTANTGQLISAGLHNLFSVYWPNFIIGIIISFIGIPIVMIFSINRKLGIYAFAIGLWLLAGLVFLSLARFVANHLPDESTQQAGQVDAPTELESTKPQLSTPQSEITKSKQPETVSKNDSTLQPQKEQRSPRLPTSGEPKPEPQEPSKPIERIHFVSDDISSSREDMPYGIAITIQTTVVMNPTHIRVECNGPIGDANVNFAPSGAGVSFSNMMGKITSIQGNVFAFSFEMPAFTPQRPLVVRLFSRQKIRALKVTHIY